MNAAEVVAKVGNGAIAALDTCERFLGIEAFAYQNANIKPEYITTVKVAEALTDPSRIVEPEALMKDLRRHAASIGRLHNLNSRPVWSRIQAALMNYVYGKERIDIRVDEASGNRPPLLLVEAKLGVHNAKGVEKDKVALDGVDVRSFGERKHQVLREKDYDQVQAKMKPFTDALLAATGTL